MVLNFPKDYTDAVSRYSQCVLNALVRDFKVEAVLVAPRRFGAWPGRPDLQIVVGAEQLWQLLRYWPTAVHVHEHPVALVAAVVYRAIARGVPRLVYTAHIQPVRRRSRWKRVILGWLLRRCSVVTAVAADTAARLVDIAAPPPRHVRVIAGGAEVNVRASEDPAVAYFRTRFGVHSTPVLCQIGLNYPLKVVGMLRLLEALPQVLVEFPKTQLMLIGAGPLRTVVSEAVARMGLTDAVILTGYVDDISLPLSVTDVYCHITLQDAAPLSVLEAMSCGKPIVAARTGGIPELIADGVDGILVDPEPAHIAHAILGLLRDPAQAHALGVRAFGTARERFTWSRVAAEFAVTYGVLPEAGHPTRFL